MGEQKKLLVPTERECYMKFIHNVNKNNTLKVVERGVE